MPCLYSFHDTATTEIYTLSLHDALPICAEMCARTRAADARSPRAQAHPPRRRWRPTRAPCAGSARAPSTTRSEEHTSELQSLAYLVCRLLLEKKKDDHNLVLNAFIESLV